MVLSPRALVLRLPTCSNRAASLKDTRRPGGAGGQEALGLGVLTLRILPLNSGVCEESQERMGHAGRQAARREWLGREQQWPS